MSDKELETLETSEEIMEEAKEELNDAVDEKVEATALDDSTEEKADDTKDDSSEDKKPSNKKKKIIIALAVVIVVAIVVIAFTAKGKGPLAKAIGVYPKNEEYGYSVNDPKETIKLACVSSSKNDYTTYINECLQPEIVDYIIKNKNQTKEQYIEEKNSYSSSVITEFEIVSIEESKTEKKDTTQINDWLVAVGIPVTIDDVNTYEVNFTYTIDGEAQTNTRDFVVYKSNSRWYIMPYEEM